MGFFFSEIDFKEFFLEHRPEHENLFCHPDTSHLWPWCRLPLPVPYAGDYGLLLKSIEQTSLLTENFKYKWQNDHFNGLTNTKLLSIQKSIILTYQLCTNLK